MKTRLLPLFVLTLGLCLPVLAQDTKEEKKDEPKSMKLHLSGDMKDIPIEEMIKWWCEYGKVEVIYQPAQIASFKISMMLSSNGTDIPEGKFGQWVSDALEQFKLVVIETSANRYAIVQATEAITKAPVLDVEAARKTEGWKWITVRIPIRYGDANAYRAALQNVVSRQGGSVNPVQQPQFLLACDRADRLMRVIDTVEAMEAEGARRATRTYELPAGIGAGAVVQAFAVICPERYSNAPGAAAAENSVVVRGTPEQLAQCDELFRQLTANAAKIAEQLKEVTRRYDVPKTPDAFADSVNKLFKDQASASAMPGANAILVKATAAKQDEVKAALELMK